MLSSIASGAVMERQHYESLLHTRLADVINYTSLLLNDGDSDSDEVVKVCGKVRDVYTNQRIQTIVFVTTDRLSAFDRVIACVPCKGATLNMISNWWFAKTAFIVPNHFISSPHPNITIAKLCKPFAIEFVCRAYITGTTGTSLWTHYEKGVRHYCGNVIPEGLVKNQRLAKSIITPTTKSAEHDRPIAPHEIVNDGIMSQEHWDQVSSYALTLFEFGRAVAAEHGLILVDTKYEFGIDEHGVVTLIDEIHTPDSSRYWIADSYEARFKAGLEPENIDKEFIRLWYTKQANCDPYDMNIPLPIAPSDQVIELARRYILLYEMICGKPFDWPLPLIMPIQMNTFQ